MSGIKDFKITDTAGYKVADVPGNSLTGTVAQNKSTFDKLGELIINKLNSAFDYLYSKNIDDGAGGSALSAYPENTIFMSIDSTSPATLFGGTWENLSSSFEIASGVTCYVWKRVSDEPTPTPTSYSLTINANGGTYSGTSPVTVTEDSTTNNSLTIPTRSNYTFNGFYDAASGGTQVYDSSANYVAGSYWSTAGKWIGTTDLTVYAHWTQNYTPTPTTYYTISTGVVTDGASSSTGGSASGSGSYSSGSTCSLSASASSGYKFTGWSTSVGGSIVSTSNPYSFTVNGSVTYYANFETVEYVTVSVGRSPTEGGTVSGGGTVEKDSYVTFTASPASGYTFVGWGIQGGGSSPSTIRSTSNPWTTTAPGDFMAVAWFGKTVSVSSDSSEGTVSGGGTYRIGETVTLTATANSGYTFWKWANYAGTTTYSTSATYSFTMASDSPTVYYAWFSRNL